MFIFHQLNDIKPKKTQIIIKETLEKELVDETEKNKDDIEHCQALEKHFEERGKAYEVCLFSGEL